ncbi:hypothetical protein KP79_PYT17153 [Mizuhopecten yessoensis]|uniref:Uncharacterized protein n=1 Tax=Mizuhopecten yessoensis TaxID=6573 RepID=A0A210QHQ3_MIZYE|nr:hypothetical protein KP79_PYT17153 [Mizuhopecten yessoensis]
MEAQFIDGLPPFLALFVRANMCRDLQSALVSARTGEAGGYKHSLSGTTEVPLVAAVSKIGVSSDKEDLWQKVDDLKSEELVHLCHSFATCQQEMGHPGQILIFRHIMLFQPHCVSNVRVLVTGNVNVSGQVRDRQLQQKDASYVDRPATRLYCALPMLQDFNPQSTAHDGKLSTPSDGH